MIEREMPQPSSSSSSGRGAVVGVLVLVCVIAGYALSQRVGVLPPGHPWSGLALLAGAAMSFMMPRVPSAQGTARMVSQLLILASAMLWLAATVNMAQGRPVAPRVRALTISGPRAAKGGASGTVLGTS